MSAEALMDRALNAEAEVESLREHEAALVAAEGEHIRRAEAAEAKLAEEREAYRSASAVGRDQRNELKAKLAWWKCSARQWETAANARKAKLAEVEAHLRDRNGEVESAGARIVDLKNRLAEAEKERDAFKATNKVLLANCRKAAASMDRLEKERDDLRAEIRSQPSPVKLDRARELAEGGGDSWRLREIARLLSGDE